MDQPGQHWDPKCGAGCGAQSRKKKMSHSWHAMHSIDNWDQLTLSFFKLVATEKAGFSDLPEMEITH